ncbi:MAG: PorV/PorQ family protein [Elusimicrobiota bacterium]
MRKLIEKSVLAGLISAAAVMPSYALLGEGPGSAGYDFLNIPVGARRIGMGCGSALKGGSDVYWWNPAGIAYVERPVASLMHNKFFEGINQQRAGYTFPMDEMSAGSVNITMLSYGEIEGYDWDGINTGGLSAGSYSLSYTQAKKFNPVLAGGLSLKLIYEQMEEENAFASAVDGGLLAEVYPGLSLGAGCKNLGVSGNFIDESPSLPTSFFFGAALKLNYFTFLAGDISYVDGELKFGSGVELSLWDTFYFRGGWDGFADADETFRMGAGWNIRGTSVNYAYAPYGKLGDTHRLDLSFKFGRPPLVERIYRRARAFYSDENFEDAWVEFHKVKALNSNYKRVSYWLEKVEEEIR